VASINITKQRGVGHMAVKGIREINVNFAGESSVVYPSVNIKKWAGVGRT